MTPNTSSIACLWTLVHGARLTGGLRSSQRIHRMFIVSRSLRPPLIDDRGYRSVGSRRATIAGKPNADFHAYYAQLRSQRTIIFKTTTVRTSSSTSSRASGASDTSGRQVYSTGIRMRPNNALSCTQWIKSQGERSETLAHNYFSFVTRELPRTAQSSTFVDIPRSQQKIPDGPYTKLFLPTHA